MYKAHSKDINRNKSFHPLTFGNLSRVENLQAKEEEKKAAQEQRRQELARDQEELRYNELVFAGTGADGGGGDTSTSGAMLPVKRIFAAEYAKENDVNNSRENKMAKVIGGGLTKGEGGGEEEEKDSPVGGVATATATADNSNNIKFSRFMSKFSCEAGLKRERDTAGVEDGPAEVSSSSKVAKTENGEDATTTQREKTSGSGGGGSSTITTGFVTSSESARLRKEFELLKKQKADPMRRVLEHQNRTVAAAAAVVKRQQQQHNTSGGGGADAADQSAIRERVRKMMEMSKRNHRENSKTTKMPTLAVARDFLFGLIGKSYTDTQFEDVCFEFGVELDDITSEREMYMREQGKTAAANATVANAATHAAPEGLSDEVIYKIDTPANRYDLLSAEGMAIALKVFLGTMALPKYRVLNATSPLYRMTVEKSVKGVRDYVVCAVLKNIKFNEHSYNSFIDFQEKLHLGLARRRTLASVGTHDMSKIGAAGTCNSFIYGCRPREQIKFVPLRQTRLLDCTGNGLEAFYADDRHISKYVPIISSLPAFPVILEAERQSVLSLPPVINSDASRIDIHTKDIFIECTATDHYKAQILVNQMVCAFSMYCADPFTIEAVKVDYEEAAPDGTVSLVCPVLEPTEVTVSLQRLNEVIGIHMESPEQCVGYLTKMMYDVKKVDGDAITVEAPAVRSDVLGPPDVLEDVAIGYGYDNIVYTECTTHGDVTQTPVGKVGQLIRTEIANAGYVELLTFSLCSRDEAFAWLGRTDSDTAAHIANPQTIEFQICRPSLMPGLLKTVSANKSLPLPQRYFECADVILIDNATNFPAVLEPVVTDGYPSPGARNQRHLAALHTSSNSSSFEHIHALMEYAFMKLGIYRKGAEPAADYTGDVYTIEKAAAGEDGAFFPGRAMDVYVHRGGQKVKVGGLGVVHPNALKAYDIANPCSYMELNMQFVCVPL